MFWFWLLFTHCGFAICTFIWFAVKVTEQETKQDRQGIILLFLISAFWQVGIPIIIASYFYNSWEYNHKTEINAILSDLDYTRRPPSLDECKYLLRMHLNNVRPLPDKILSIVSSTITDAEIENMLKR